MTVASLRFYTDAECTIRVSPLRQAGRRGFPGILFGFVLFTGMTITVRTMLVRVITAEGRPSLSATCCCARSVGSPFS